MSLYNLLTWTANCLAEVVWIIQLKIIPLIKSTDTPSMLLIKSYQLLFYSEIPVLFGKLTGTNSLSELLTYDLFFKESQ